jgi:hypothetical protein
MPKMTIPSNLLKPTNYQVARRFEVEDDGGSSLVRIPLPQQQTGTIIISTNEREEEKKWWAEGDSDSVTAGSLPNSGSRPPPCQGGILTRLDHRPYIQCKNFLPKYML